MTVKAHLRGGPLNGEERPFATAPRSVFLKHLDQEHKYVRATITEVDGRVIAATYVHVDPAQEKLDKIRKYAEGLREGDSSYGNIVAADLESILDGAA